MPPKRGNTTRSNGVARRGRASARGRAKGGRDHARVLSDITEESASQVQVQETPVQQAPKRAMGDSKKRSFGDSAGDDSEIVTPARRETRAQAAKRSKRDHNIQTEPLSAVQEPNFGTNRINAAYQESLHDFSTFNGDVLVDSSLYTPSLNLLFFIHLSSLDTDADTERMTLSLIELTLTAANWHTGLSGMVQPVACFLIASLLTRKQNLVEDIAASVEIFGLGYGDLIEGYRLLWEWRDNMAASVGGYAERLADLPEPTLLLAFGESEGVAWNNPVVDESFDERPEPERWDEAVGVRVLPDHRVEIDDFDCTYTDRMADQHIKAAEAKGGPTGEQVIFELHPALKIDHSNALRRGLIDMMDMVQDEQTDLDPIWPEGAFPVELVNDILVGQTQTNSALDEMYLSQPPVKEIQVVVEERYDFDPHDDLFNYDWRDWYIPPVGITNLRDGEGLTFGKVLTEVHRRFGGREHAFVKYIHSRGGFPFTREEKEMIEGVDEITEKNDPFPMMPALEPLFDE